MTTILTITITIIILIGILVIIKHIHFKKSMDLNELINFLKKAELIRKEFIKSFDDEQFIKSFNEGEVKVLIDYDGKPYGDLIFSKIIFHIYVEDKTLINKLLLVVGSMGYITESSVNQEVINEKITYTFTAYQK